ncbi:hypothetical protein E2C01_023270 [Portunus trituberculatus]|uniref:Uncharacterized protein n=1 Tax=Portunus trituberculatus TaxID=210409 RepID=A0A5B7E9K3_PORTR|nr:hypothetical protein [Portunus trituberculatus]
MMHAVRVGSTDRKLGNCNHWHTYLGLYIDHQLCLGYNQVDHHHQEKPQIHCEEFLDLRLTSCKSIKCTSFVQFRSGWKTLAINGST